MAFTLTDLRESKVWKMISELSVLHWIITVTPGLIAGVARRLHGMPLENSILWFVGISALTLVIVSHFKKASTSRPNYWRLAIPVVAIALLMALPLLVTEKSTTPGAQTAIVQQPNAPPPATKKPKPQPTPVTSGRTRHKPSQPATQAPLDQSPYVGHLEQGPCSNAQIGGSGNQATVNCGPPPAVFTLTVLDENAKVSENLYQTDYQLKVQSSSAIPSLHVRAESPSIASTNMSCLQVLAVHENYMSGNAHDYSRGAGFCETHAENVASGIYQISFLSTKPEKVNLTYQPD